ncbi:hypothetical protein BDF21DRAFT_496949 [Thamnidium elegans]|nr:hypothetical protein BDF21DRAFT_496949 [Thamnidium elegans]
MSMSLETQNSMPQLVAIINACFVCSKTYSTVQKLQDHLLNHQIKAKKRPKNVKRTKDSSICIVQSDDDHQQIEKHFGCPSCFEHFKESKQLENHFRKHHSECMPQLPTQQTNETEESQPEVDSDDESQAYGKRSASESSSLDSKAELMNPSCLSFVLPSADDRLIIDRFDVSAAFYNFQQSILTHKWKLSLEDHIHCAMASISILLLAPNRYPADLLPFFDEQQINSTIGHIELKYGLKKPRRNAGTFFRWTNELTVESKKNQSSLNWRPDIAITRLQGVRWRYNLGFGEAKPAQPDSNHFAICKDLLRVGVFCKNSIDSQNMDGVMGLKIVGRTITFYVMVLPATGIYGMYELGEIQVPSSVADIPKLLMDMATVSYILDVFCRVCVPAVTPITTKQTPATISDEILTQIFSSTRSRKRPCHLKHHYN